MGFKCYQVENWTFLIHKAIFNLISESPPFYSSSIAAAWEVVEKLNLLSGHNLLCQTKSGYSVAEEIEGTWRHLGIGETAPHAICLAALKAIGVSI